MIYKKFKKVDGLIREKLKFILLVGLIFSGASFFYLSNIPKEFESKMLLRLGSSQDYSFAIKEVDFLLKNKNFFSGSIAIDCSDSGLQKNNDQISFVDKIYFASVSATQLYLVSFRSTSFETNHRCLSSIFNGLSSQELLARKRSEKIASFTQEVLRYKSRIDYLEKYKKTSLNLYNKNSFENNLISYYIEEIISRYENIISLKEEKIAAITGISFLSISDNPISVYPKMTVKILLSFLFGILVALAGFILKSFFED
jgi:hypothetical protein